MRASNILFPDGQERHRMKAVGEGDERKIDK